MPSTIRRQLFLDHGRVQIECPRIMTDEVLADVLSTFVAEVKRCQATEPTKPITDQPSKPPAVRKRIR
jgi:hypothetical protein